ncbi:MAG: hypothetical protein GY842_19280 [bacterium]|nr:hypothetical protein [bacterium]
MLAVLEGRQPDRCPVSFWHHFAPHQRYGSDAAQAHLDHLRRYDLDFLKIMNDNGVPRIGEIRTMEDLAASEAFSGDEPEFARQLELIETLAAELRGEVLLTTTVFNAWTTLRRLVKPQGRSTPPRLEPHEDVASTIIRLFLAQDRNLVRRALATLGESLARFASRCLQAGADGVFLSVRDDWVDSAPGTEGTYDDLVRPTDLQILEAASGGRFNVLHVCGRAVGFETFARYPVHVLNWADRAAGPSIAQARDQVAPALCGGVDNLGVLADGTPEDCTAQVRDAVAQAGDRPILIAPGCTYDPQRVSSENLQAMCDAARTAQPQ